MKIRVEIRNPSRQPIMVDVKNKVEMRGKGKDKKRVEIADIPAIQKKMKEIAFAGISIKTSDGYDYYPAHRISLVCYDGK